MRSEAWLGRTLIVMEILMRESGTITFDMAKGPTRMPAPGQSMGEHG